MDTIFKIKKVAGLLSVTMMLLFVTAFSGILGSGLKAEAADMEQRAVWISYLDYAGLKDKSQAEFTANINAMYDKAKSENMNTVIVQVRAFNDAIYPSAYFGWCSYITSNPAGPGYDPLAIMIEAAHSKGLRFEAWINPYRINTTTILNPGSVDTIYLIVNGVEEIVRNYNVDGIHFDDYFYKGYPEVSVEQKKANVNEMIRIVYWKIKTIKPEVEFGISPQGNIDNCRAAGADVDTWLSNSGYIDYIMPQIYWTDNYGSGGGTTMYSNRLAQWKALNKNGIKMYVGLALYQAADKPSTDIGWSTSSTNLLDQANIAGSAGASGYSLFRYSYLNAAAARTELDNLNDFHADRSKVEAFVTRLYRNVLNREPDADGLNYWSNTLVHGTETGASVAEGFIFCREFEQKNIGDSQYIDILYRTCLDRESDAAGRNGWLDALASGMSRRGVFAGFINSNEFKDICQNYGILVGNVVLTEARDQNAGVTMYVYRCYQQALGRTPETEGLNYWTALILNKTVTPEAAAKGFLESAEFRNKNYSDMEYVKTLYRLFLNREYDEGGLIYWLARLAGGSSREEVMSGFSKSGEFKGFLLNYGL